jgi:hypothetical protein
MTSHKAVDTAKTYALVETPLERIAKKTLRATRFIAWVVTITAIIVAGAAIFTAVKYNQYVNTQDSPAASTINANCLLQPHLLDPNC